MLLNRALQVAAVLAVCLLAPNRLLHAQPSAGTSVPATHTAQTMPVSAVRAAPIQARMQQIQEDKSLDDAVRGKALDLYRQTLEQLRLTEEWQAKAAAFEKATDDAPGMLADAKARLQEPATEPQVDLPSDATFQQVDQALARAQSELSAARRQVSDLEQEARFRSDRLATDISRQLETIRTLVEDIQRQLAVPPPADEPAEVTLARRTLLQAQDQLLASQRSALYRERRSYQARADLLNAQRDLSAAKFSRLQKRVATLRDMVNDRRLGEAQLALLKAQETLRQVGDRYPAITELAQVNVDLAQRRGGAEGTTVQIKQTTEDLARTSTELARLSDAFDDVSERAGAAGTSRAVYQMLRRQRASLPDVAKLQVQRRDNQARLEQARQDQFDLDDLRKASLDIESSVKEVMLRLPPEARRSPELERQATALLKDRLSAIDALKADYATYLTRMDDLDTRQRHLIEETRKFSRFIDEHVLWVRSTAALSSSDLPRAGAALAWLASPSCWMLVGRAAWQDAAANWGVWATTLLPVIVLVLMRRILVLRLKALSANGPGARPESIRRSLGALVLTLLIAAPWPLLLLLAGWLIGSLPEPPPFVLAVSTGLIGASLVFLPLEVLRQVCRTGGLAHAHFLWPEASLLAIRPWLGRLIVVIAPLVFLATAASSQGDDSRNITTAMVQETASLGRLAFLLVMLVLAAFCLAMLRPSGKTLHGATVLRGGWVHRFRHVWYALAVGTPLLLAAASVSGYHYTALHLSHRLLAMFVLVLSLILLQSLLQQWMTLAFRRLAADRLRAQADTRKVDPLGPTQQAPSAPASKPKSDSDEMKLSAVGTQSRQILRYLMAAALLIGGWFIWADVLPALTILRTVELWSHTVTVSQSVIGRDGAATIGAVEKVIPVTLADLLSALGLAVITVAASRNIPGLLEITLLRRLNWDFGSRYALSTIVRYLIIVAGAVIVLELIGITWSKIQWLIAAMTVGLGFGLQEIFANFVSGLILLFERPMRVGDMVTVGEVTGIVTKIRIRATTIMDFDRKELVVPNKEFITGKLMNWTLSDTMLRAVIPVGVNYDADTRQVLDVLIKTAREHPDVLKTPPPECEFVNFGDSSLNFELRAFVKDWPTCKKVKNELQIAILQAFRQAGISIPFPQREIHIRTVPPEAGA